MKKFLYHNGQVELTPSEAVNLVEWDVIVHYMDDDTCSIVDVQAKYLDDIEGIGTEEELNIAFLTRYLEIAEHDLVIG